MDRQVEEAKNVNMSLTTLGRVILSLSKKEAQVPFRESALTMLMKNALTGNCRTTLVVAISESPDMMSESISSMRFGMTCGSLKNNVIKETVDVNA